VQVIRELPAEPIGKCVLALGNFDGVHLGHRRLLDSGREKARQLGVKLGVLLFEPHPLKMLFPERVIGLLTTQEERLKTFAELGVDIVFLLPFNGKMAETTPEEFVEEILLRMGVAHIIVGFNYSFGAQGKGTPEQLQHYGQEYGFGVSVLQAQTIDGRVISSTAIRKALLQGDIVQTKKLLGHSPSLFGKVVQGERRGRELGYPTANLKVSEDLLIPKRGVYAVWAEINGERVHGMMNIGMKPTFHAEFQLTIEVHFFKFDGDLYNRNLAVYIEERIRDERKFPGVKELMDQLERDAFQAQKALSESLNQ
jgi:riboflavin kinase/FMN adenylyltransferase